MRMWVGDIETDGKDASNGYTMVKAVVVVKALVSVEVSVVVW